MHFLIGLFIVAAVIYFAFVRNDTDTAEEAIKKIARMVVFFVIALIILFVVVLMSGG